MRTVTYSKSFGERMLKLRLKVAGACSTGFSKLEKGLCPLQLPFSCPLLLILLSEKEEQLVPIL